ncbi:MAG: peptidylprolyl isomerase [Candidatus Thalassarchaeum sp.]
MPIPEVLQKAWDAANQSLESETPENALEILRSEAWDACENNAQKSRTLRYAGDAGTMLGEMDTARQKRHWQRAHKSYRNALNFDPKDKATRRSMNKLASMMDEQAISLGGGLQMFDEGNPTPLGLVAMLVAAMLLLVSFKVISDWFDESENPVVTLEISYMPTGSTERTTVFIEIELYEDEAPLHVENFILLAEESRYDFTTFHRIIDGFMIQGGDFVNRDGSGGYTGKWYGYCDGKQFDSSNNRYSPESCDQSRWTLPDEADNGLLHIPGVLAMAKTSSPNTGSSQFYIVPEDSTPNHLDGVHTVFGMVVSGLDHVTAISEVATDSSDRPQDEVRLMRVTVND